MKTDVQKLISAPAIKAKSLFLYGNNPLYLEDITNKIIEKSRKDFGNIEIKRFFQDDFLSDGAMVQSQGDLFAQDVTKTIIVILEATDKSVKTVERLQAETSPDVVLIFPCMMGTSTKKLKTLHEKAPDLAMLGCYLNNHNDYKRYVHEQASIYGLQLESEALTFLAYRMEEDATHLHQDLLKLSLYADNASSVSYDDAHSCAANPLEEDIFPLVGAVFERNRQEIVVIYQKLFASQEMGEVVFLLRLLNIQAQKLLQLKSIIASGTPLSQAFQQMRPPIFFKQQPAFQKQLQLWQNEDLYLVIDRLREAEAQFKSTSSLSSSQFGRLLLALAGVKASNKVA
jgi:DNA polymerase-3 subunit delta